MSEHQERVLVVMAHPDDPEFACGGTIARWVREGKYVGYLIITSGDKGTDDPTMTRERLMAIREEEQRAAARVLGVHEVHFLRYPDGELFPTLDLRRDIAYHIRRFRPDIVVCQDPTAYYFGDTYINHPDHRAAGEATLAAVFPLARDWLNFPEHLAEGLYPHKVRDVYISTTPNPTTWVDITDFIEIKLEAILQHKSQVKDPDALVERWKERLRAVDESGRTIYREGFRVMHLPA